jgi:hypothetical protein
MSWIMDALTGASAPPSGRKGATFALSMVLDAAGNPFSLESCKKEYFWDENDALANIRATEPGTGAVRIKTYTLTASGKPAVESQWVLQS